ncbi:hypothetical protein H4582DRAFT_2070228 [Lactarius indigo]|nr:hypothetical protein H4582DRAFT_2070228 [Lactarius indigo]
MFMRRCRSDGDDATFVVVERNQRGGYDSNHPGSGEANFDVLHAKGITWPAPYVFYDIGGLLVGSTPDGYQPVNNNELFFDRLSLASRRRLTRQTTSTSRPSLTRHTAKLFASPWVAEVIATTGYATEVAADALRAATSPTPPRRR